MGAGPPSSASTWPQPRRTGSGYCRPRPSIDGAGPRLAPARRGGEEGGRAVRQRPRPMNLRRLASRAWRARRRLGLALRERRPPAVAVPGSPARAGRPPVRVGVVGAGGMGRDQCVELVAVADLRPEALERLAKQLELPWTRFYGDAAELLDKESPDVLCIATTAPSHVALARTAVEAGVRRVVVEKPMSVSVAASRELVELAEEAGALVAVDHGRRWSPDYRSIRAYIGRGHIGAVRQLSVTGGAGGMGMTGTHFFDLARFLTGAEADWVTAHLHASGRPNPRGDQFHDPEGYVLAGFRDGVRLFLDLSGDVRREDRLVVIQGEFGRIVVDERAGVWRAATSFSPDLAFPFRATLSPGGLFGLAVRELLDEPAAVACGPRDGLAATEMAVAAHLSDARDHRPVALPLEGDDVAFEVAFA